MTERNLKIRRAGRKDIPLIFTLINEMALYEKRPQDMTGSPEALEHWLFDTTIGTFYIAEVDGETAGYALYYPVFGSFAAAGRVHLEDIFLREVFRGKGLGKAFFALVAAEVLKEGYAGMEWSCLAWNTLALDFYDRIGAHRETGREYLFMSEKELCQLCCGKK